VMGIEPKLAVGHNARNSRFREAVAAFIKDRSWPILRLLGCPLSPPAAQRIRIRFR